MNDIRLKTQRRLRLQSWRRGTREMDLVLGPFADTHLASMDEETLCLFDALLQWPEPVLTVYLTGNQDIESADCDPKTKELLHLIFKFHSQKMTL